MLPLDNQAQIWSSTSSLPIKSPVPAAAGGVKNPSITRSPNNGPQVSLAGGGMLSPSDHNLGTISGQNAPRSLVAEALKNADDVANIYYKKRWGEGDNVGLSAVAKSGIKRSLEDLEGFFGFFRRLIFLPLGIYEAFKLKAMSQDEGQNHKQMISALLNLQEAFVVYQEAKIIDDDNGGDSAEALNKAKDAFKAILKANAEAKGEILDESKIDQELDRLYAKEALKRDAKLDLMGDMSYTLKWYAVNTLKTLSSVLAKIAEVGFPILSGLARVFELMVRSVESIVEGRGLSGEFEEWVDAFDLKNITKDLSKNETNESLSHIATNIKTKQDLALKFAAILKEGLSISSFVLFLGAAVLGVLALSGVIAAAASVVVLKASVIVGSLALPIAAGYLVYRLSRWVKRNTMISKAEMTLFKTQFINDNDPEKSQKLAKREKAIAYLLKHDGRFASFYLVQSLWNENKSENAEKPIRNFLKNTRSLSTEDWTLLNRLGEEDIQSAAQLLSRRLNLT